MSRKPVLQAMVLADHVYRDAATGKHVIAGTFTRYLKLRNVTAVPNAPLPVVDGKFVGRPGTPFLYVALVDVDGDVPLELKYVDLKSGDVQFAGQIRISHNDPLSVAEFIIPLPSLFIDREGEFSLDLLHDNELLGSWRVSHVVTSGTDGTPPSGDL